jgi:hypothetical protein
MGDPSEEKSRTSDLHGRLESGFDSAVQLVDSPASPAAPGPLQDSARRAFARNQNQRPAATVLNVVFKAALGITEFTLMGCAMMHISWLAQNRLFQLGIHASLTRLIAPTSYGE